MGLAKVRFRRTSEEWDEASPCHCEACGWHGTVAEADFKEETLKAPNAGEQAVTAFFDTIKHASDSYTAKDKLEEIKSLDRFYPGRGE